MAERVEGEPLAAGVEPGGFDGGAEAFADVAVVEPAADRGAEDLSSGVRFPRPRPPLLVLPVPATPGGRATGAAGLLGRHSERGYAGTAIRSGRGRVVLWTSA